MKKECSAGHKLGVESQFHPALMFFKLASIVKNINLSLHVINVETLVFVLFRNLAERKTKILSSYICHKCKKFFFLTKFQNKI